MDLRVLVLSADHDLAELVRAQVENLGCRCSVVATYDDLGTGLEWADAAVVDLAGPGLDDLSRLRVEAPKVKVLAIAPDEPLAAAARNAGVEGLLQEPFSIAEVIEAVRAIGRVDADVVDLRSAAPAEELDDAPWWATR
jgi:DNA-binding response OmpR family regulator